MISLLNQVKFQDVLNPLKWRTLFWILKNKVQVKRKRVINSKIYRKALSAKSIQYSNLAFWQEQNLEEIAQECFESRGYYPISFSYPKSFINSNTQKTDVVSSIIPYENYSFDNEQKYHHEYSKAHLGITQKKSGWDCFRHLEIIGSGSTPLFLDAKSIPKYTMVHYPKSYLQEAARLYLKKGLIPAQKSLDQLIAFADENLTCEAMCKYFSKMAKIELSANDSILFVDSELYKWPDYLSVFNFIGLKRIYGERVFSAYPEPDFLYTDTSMDTQKLYGRGFGYSKTLTRHDGTQSTGTRIKYVLISHLQRDWILIEKYLHQYPEAKFVLFWGADEVISKEVLTFVKKIPSHTLFVREVK